MRPTWQSLSSLAIAALLASGCETAPPGAGVINPEAGKIGSEKAGDRTDLPTPNMSTGDASLAAPAADSATATDANPNQAVVPPPTSASGAPEPSSSPPKAEIPAGAEGATKPSGNIETGTPKSPQ